MSGKEDNKAQGFNHLETGTACDKIVFNGPKFGNNVIYFQRRGQSVEFLSKDTFILQRH